jgi:uncharacterized protein (TIGR02246 family)
MAGRAAGLAKCSGMRPAQLGMMVISLGAIVAFSVTVKAVEPDPIRAVLDAQMAAWNKGDIDGFMEGYARSPKTTFVSGDGVTRGWQTVRDRYAKKYDSPEKMGTLTFSDLEITRLGNDAAIVLGSWSLQRKEDQPHGKFTLLFRKLPEGWRIVLDHTSAATPSD